MTTILDKLDYLEDSAFVLSDVLSARDVDENEFFQPDLDETYSDDEERINWEKLAACIGKQSLFIGELDEPRPVKRRRVAKAKEICATCPVQEQCRQKADEEPNLGVWAGESELERDDRTDETFYFLVKKLKNLREGKIDV